MNNKEAYNIAINELEIIEKEYNELKKDEKVRRYNQLKFRRDILIADKNDFYKRYKNEEYNNCKHLLITTYAKPSRLDKSKVVTYCGCLKCGLNEKVLNVNGWFIDYDQLSLDEQIMFDFLSNKPLKKENVTDIECDLELARAIYNKIMEAHPKISDKKAIKYLGIALDNIRNIDMTNERKESRVKRLGLRKDFNDWQKDDVMN